ncbi:MAG: hypothetical protein ACOZNI_36860 [Myxococcota bacterium]
MARWIPATLAVLALGALATGDLQRRTHAPAIELPYESPAVAHPEVLPAWRFVGPLHVEGMSREELCGETDRARLLREGKFGWRVVLAKDGQVGALPGGWIPRGPDGMTYLPFYERVTKLWEEADARVAELCGVKPVTEVLLVMDPVAAKWWDAMGTAGYQVFRSTEQERLWLPVGGTRRFTVADEVQVLAVGSSDWKMFSISGWLNERRRPPRTSPGG